MYYVRTNMEIYLKLLDLKTMKTFKKYFKTEFERDKFIRKLRYSKRLKVLEIGGYYDKY